MQMVAWNFMVGKSTVSTIIREVCSHLWQLLSPTYLPMPTKDDFTRISREFYEKWNFPMCLGAIDGKHITIQAPKKSGTEFFNYKKTFSVVLMAACDAKYRFTMVDIGAHGSLSDGAVFRNSNFGAALERGKFDLPSPQNLPDTNIAVPHVFVADEAFPLKEYIMRPFPGRGLSQTENIFNYRLSRARRTIENAFGIFVARWRLFRSNITADVVTINKMVGAAVCLHNFLMKDEENNSNGVYCPDSFLAGIDLEREINASQFNNIGRMASNNPANNVKQIRNTFMNYFVTEAGEMPH